SFWAHRRMACWCTARPRAASVPSSVRSRRAVRSTTRTAKDSSTDTAAPCSNPNVQPRSTLVVLLPRQTGLFLKPVQLDLELSDLLVEFRLQLLVGLIRPQPSRRKRFRRKI